MALSKNKKMIQISLKMFYYKKLKVLQEKFLLDTESEIGSFIIEKYIDEYERKNGEITTKE